jgi:DDE superfamily endonuclease
MMLRFILIRIFTNALLGSKLVTIVSGMPLNVLELPIKKTLQHPKVDQEKRTTFCQKVEEYKVAGKPIVYIDESGFAHDMPRTHGYALKGQRCYGKHDWGAKGRTNVIGAMLGGILLTVSLFQTTVNTAVFNAWVIQDLLPKLPKNSVIIMDNATFHKGQDMMKALDKEGHSLLYLPPYSPDLNPIEHKWAQAKAIRRKVGGKIENLFQYFKL